MDNNPLTTSYDLPPFSSIRLEHLVPAVEEIIADSRVKVAEIIVSQTPHPTWDDLVLAMDEVKARLDDTIQVIDVIHDTTSRQTWADAVKHCHDLAITYKRQLWQNQELYELYQRLADSPIAALFDTSRRKVLQGILREFRLSAILLAPAQRQYWVELNNDITRLEREFSSRVRQSTFAWGQHIEDESHLAGLPEPVKRVMAGRARARDLPGWSAGLDEEQFRAVMRCAKHRPLRKQMWMAYHNRACADALDNDDVLSALLQARHEKAQLLGYEDFARLVMDEPLHTSSDQVLGFLLEAFDKRRDDWARDTQQLQAFAAQQGITQLQPWDHEYLAEKLCQQAAGDLGDLREYFPLDRVLSQLCQFVQRLFGVQLLEQPAFVGWHEDVRLFVANEHQRTLGYLFIDPYRPEEADGPAQTLGLRYRRLTAEGRPRLPMAVLRCQLTPGAGDEPCLLEPAQLHALMHEFGRCLQLLLTGEPYRDLSRLDGPGRSAAEFAGHALEQWCFSREFLLWMSSHCRTGEPIPDDTVDRWMAAAQVQTRWSTMNSLFRAFFDFEVHRTHGDERHPQEVFDALNADLGQWPPGVRPFNHWDWSSQPAARAYSNEWARELAKTAFERFTRHGVFAVETGRAFREAFLSQGEVRSLQVAFEAFTGSPYTRRLSLDTDDLPLADRPVAADVPLIERLTLSQRHMIRLNAATPRPSSVIRQHLDYWFRRTFPALAANVAVETLAVRTLQVSPPSTAGPVAQRTTTDIVFLETLVLRGFAGTLDRREFFGNMDNIEIITRTGHSITAPAALNNRGVKEAIKRLVSATPALHERLIEKALDDFWSTPADFSLNRNVCDWLADELGTQLKVSADLQRLDAALDPKMHKTLTDYVLPMPDAASRASLAERVRPGAFSLGLFPSRWAFSVPVPGAVVLAQHDNASEPGNIVLFRPGSPLQMYGNLAALKADLEDENTDDIDLVSITDNFLARLVTDLRDSQKAAVSRALRNGPQEGEEITAWLNRMDAAADLGDRLDLAGVMDEREMRLNLNRLNDWLHRTPYVTGADRLAWWRATQVLQTTLTDSPPPPDPVMLATPDALRDRTRRLLADAIKVKYPTLDPDEVSLSIRKTVLDPHAPTGTSPFGSGVSQGDVKGVIDDQRSMTEWAMANLTQDERNAPHVSVEGPMGFAQIVEVIERANVGARLPGELQLAARERQAQWMSLKARQMRSQAWAAHISGDLRHDRDNTALQLVLAALDSPTAAGRRTVNGHEVVVRQLRWGDSVLKALLTFGVKTTASRPSLTLYTPGAPDGKTFRDVDAANARALQTALVQTLTATPQMTHWLISHLPLSEQAAQLASLLPATDNLTLEEKIKKVTQSVFAWAKDRAQNDFASTFSSPVVEGDLLRALHETQISHALKTTDALTVTNAERDSTSAREGRRHGITLLTGAMSLFPAGRLGGILGRAILPTMVGGAAVAAIDDEGGNVGQWTRDFIAGLGEVLAEAGQDLILARAGQRRSKAPPALSSLPRLPDPELEPFLLKGFDGKGLVPEGRNRYRDASGYAYLKMGTGYCKTDVQGGERFIHAPNNRTHQRTVTWKNNHWHLEEPQRLRGGGTIQSLFGYPPELPEQRKYNALIEAVLVKLRSPSPEALNVAKEIFYSMPDELAERLLRESMAETNVTDIAQFRSRISDLNQGLADLSEHTTAHENLLDKMNTWNIVTMSSKNIEENVADVHITDSQKIKIYDTILAHKNEFFTERMIRVNTTTITDNLTGAVFLTYTSKQGRKKKAIDKIAQDTREMIDAAEAKMQARTLELFPGSGPDVSAARQKYANSVEYYNDLLETLKEEKTRRHKPGLLTEIRNHRIPYIIANKGKTLRTLTLVTGEDIKTFNDTLTHYEPFDTEIVTKAKTHKVTAPQPTAPDPVVPEPAPTPDVFQVDYSPLAKMQMSYANFPEAAGMKVQEIMDDIRAGRVTTKKISRYYWYDMSRLAPGGGRGAWRAAFERQGDTWILKGFYDYHVNGPATVWGG